MPPIPAELIVLTLVLVVIPSVAAIFLRFILYRHLIFLQERVRRLIKKQASGQKPSSVEELEKRFADARISLEQVNTAALIDQVYSREKVWLFSCEQIDYFCRILPNLLLSFGLLGTFLGITINLAALSQTINQTTASNVSSLVAQLEKPLQGMSIAFTTSLTGLLFSAFLTVFNFVKNTSQAKYGLISSLEDYLDNVYQPQIQGDTRLDKIVNKMVSQQSEFLTKFGVTVRDVVEQALGGVAKQIAQGNKEATDLAKQVYEQFKEGAGTIASAASNLNYAVVDFQKAVNEVKTTAGIFEQVGKTFDNSQFPQKLLEATADLTNIQDRFSQSAASLAETVAVIKNSVNQLHLSSQQLLEMGAEISRINKTSVQILAAHQSNQQSLSEIIPLLNQGAQSFDSAITKIEQLEQRIFDKADSLNRVEVALKHLLETVLHYTEHVNLAIESLGDRFILSISENIGNNNQYIQTAIANFEGFTNQLSIKIDTSKLDLMDLLKDNNVKLIGEYKTVGERLFSGIKQEAEISIKASQFLGVKIQECCQQLVAIKQEIYQQRESRTNIDSEHNTVDDFADLFG